jgi:NAD+--asparagine ADP-ribosyltransferase
MNKFIKFLLFVSLFISTISYAKYKTHITKEKKGQRYYLNRCSSCHGNGNRGGNMYSMNEWEELFKNDAKELILLHEDEENTTNIIKYIKSNNFQKEKKRMLKFIKEFAYDSETVPTCN